jgi:hypothetical protein
MRRDLLGDADSGGLGAPAAIYVVAALSIIALIAALALCGSSVSKSTQNSSPSTAANDNQPQLDSTPPEKEAVEQGHWQRVQEGGDSPAQVGSFCSAISLPVRQDAPDKLASSGKKRSEMPFRMQNGHLAGTSLTEGALETAGWSDTVPSLTSETSQNYASTSGKLILTMSFGLLHETGISLCFHWLTSRCAAAQPGVLSNPTKGPAEGEKTVEETMRTLRRVCEELDGNIHPQCTLHRNTIR